MSGTLHAAIADYFSGDSSFVIVDGSGVQIQAVRRDFSAFAGQRVLWVMDSTIDAVMDLFSALLDGVRPLLVAASLPQDKQRNIAEHFTVPVYCAGSIQGDARSIENETSIFLYVMTSGSTGMPKAVAATEEALCASVTAISQSQNTASVRSTINSVPFAYSYGFVNQLLWALLNGRTLIIDSATRLPASLIEIVRVQQVEMLCLVAAQIKMLEHFATSEAPLSCVKCINLAGSLFPVQALSSLRRLFPNAEIYNNYGCTEALPRLTAKRIDGVQADEMNVGRPLNGVEIRIAGDTMPGLVEFRSDASAIAYLSGDGRHEFLEGWVQSGDAGTLDENGELWVHGRVDQVVTLGGERHSLLDVEQVAKQLGFTQVFCWIEHDAVLFALSDDANALSLSELKKLLQKNLRSAVAKVIWPQWAAVVPTWPVLPNGKTDRMALKQLPHSSAEAVQLLWDNRRKE